MSNFPTSISTNNNLYIAVNGLQTTLAANIGPTDTTIQLNSTTSFPTTGLVTIDNAEVVSYTGVSGPNLTGCVRGADGTTALSHNTGVTVGLTIVAAHHNLLKDEVIAIETALGANLSNVFPATPTTGSGNVVLATSPTITSPTLVTPALGTPASGVLTNCTGLPLTTGVTGTLSNSNTTATSSPTASDIVSRDANGNTQVNTIVENFSTTVTAAGTTALSASTSPLQQFTGTTTQTVTLPDATTLSTGYQIHVLNRSTGAITVNNNGGSLQQTVPASTQTTFTCTSTGSANGTWDVSASSAASGGTVTSVSGTTNQITSTNPTTTPVLALANPLTLPGPATAGGNIAMASNKVTGLAAATANGDAIRYEQVNGFRVLQIVETTDTTGATSTSSTFATTNLTGSITPASTASKVLVQASLALRCTSSGSVTGNVAVDIRIKRGSTVIRTWNQAALERDSSNGSTTRFSEFYCTFSIYDSPASSSAVTYTVEFANDAATGSVSIDAVASPSVLLMTEVG